MATGKKIDVIFNEDGTVDFDQIGYKGKQCSGDIDDLVKALGSPVKTKRKVEYNDKQKVKINQGN